MTGGPAAPEPVSASPEAGRHADRFWLVAAIAAYAVFQVFMAWGARHDNDFKHIYLGARAVLEGDSPYPVRSMLMQANAAGLRGAALNPYVYLPFTGISLGWLAVMPFPVASAVWFALNQLLVAVSVAATALAVVPRRPAAAAAILVTGLAVCHPVTRTLTAGQLNFVLMAAVAGAFLALCRGRDALAGTLLGFAAVFKLSPAAFMLPLLLGRRWRAAGAMAATAGAALAVSLAVSGPAVHREFLGVVGDMGYGRSTWQHVRADGGGATFWKDPPNQSVNALLTHVIVAGNGIADPWIASTQPVANAATTIFAACAILAYAATAARMSRAATPSPSRSGFSPSEQGLFLATTPLSLLLPSLMWDHYLVALAPPALWLAARAAAGRRPAMLAAVAACWAVVCMPWDFHAPAWRSGPGVALMSVKLAPTLAIFALVLAETRKCQTPKPASCDLLANDDSVT